MNIGRAHGLPNSTVKCFAEDPDGYLWIGTFDGLVHYDGHSFEVVRSGYVESMLACDSGLYINTSEGLDYLTFRDRSSQHCTWEDESRQKHTFQSIIKGVVSVGTSVFVLDSGGRLWKGTSVAFEQPVNLDITNGLAIQPYGTNGLLVLTPNQLALYDVTQESVLAQGTHTIPSSGWENMYYSTVLDMIIVGKGIGYETQAFRIKDGKIEEVDCHGLLPASIKAVTDYQDATYMATDCKGLYCFVADSCQEQGYIKEIGWFTPVNGLAGFAVHSLYADRIGNLWIGTYRNGISILSPRLDAFQTYSMASGDLTYNTVSGIYVDQGVMYAGMDGGGLIIVDTHRHTTQTITTANSSLPGDNIMGLCFDGQELWLGIYGHGLFTLDLPLGPTGSSTLGELVNSSTLNFQQVDLAALGAPQNYEVVWKLWHDERGYVIAQGQQTNIIQCCGTPKLVNVQPRRNPEDSLLQLATHIPELKNYELLCAYQDIDGTIYYGSTTGVISVQPDKLQHSQRRSHVWIDRLLVLTDSTHYFIGAKQLPEIQLAHHQNHFTIHFSVPRISPPDDTRFRFQLEGIDPHWREAQDTRQISYTAVPPGHYVFHIVCDTADGQWSAEDSTLTIHISPPWYATWWAYTAFALVLIVIISFILRAYIARRQIAYQLIYEKRKHELSERECLQAEHEHEQAKRAQQERIDFLTNITHELRTPMFLITAPIEEMLEQTGTVLRAPRSYLKNILHNAQRITRLIDHMLYAWNPDASPMQCNLQEANIPALCRQLSADYQLLCQQKGLHFSYTSTLTNLRTQMDVEKLELILSNLVSNAFKYTTEGGSVELRVEAAADEILFCVKDTGSGISPEELPKIFLQGYRSKTTADVKGNGLGLYFVRQLAHLMGGEITVESVLGQGSTFTLRLPIKDVSHIQPSRTFNSQLSTFNSPLGPTGRLTLQELSTLDNPTATHTILVIDDEPQTLQLLSRVLGHEYRVLTAEDGEQGLEIARQELPDLIICDVMMPRMDGFQFVAAIKDNNGLQHIPVIMFTARNLDEDQITAFRHGADAYLTKPVSLELLRTRVWQLLHREGTAAAFTQKPSSSLSKQEQLFMLRIRELINSNLQNPQLSVDYLAQELGMSVSSLYKKVRQMTGHGTVDLIIDTRIRHAVEQMRTGETNITRIAELCGFNEVRSFRAAFKNRTGMTPKQYAQQL